MILGVDIGGTKSAVILGTEEGEILGRHEWLSLAHRGPDAMLEDVIRFARRFSGFTRVGVSIGGPLNSNEGVIYSPPHLPGWDAFPLKRVLEDTLSTPVNVAHDAAACAYAEYLWGAGKKAENLAYFTCGTGFGVGYVFHGRIHTGAGGTSCEVGHVGLRDDGPVSYGKRGSVESYCSGTGLGLLAHWKYPDRWPVPPEGVLLSCLADQKDFQAQEILAINADAVGEISAILADSLGLDCILLGSLALYLGECWIAQVRQSFRSRVLPAIAQRCSLNPSGLGGRLQDCSTLAAALAN